jgi:hypothetical protein
MQVKFEFGHRPMIFDIITLKKFSVPLSFVCMYTVEIACADVSYRNAKVDPMILTKVFLLNLKKNSDLSMNV